MLVNGEINFKKSYLSHCLNSFYRSYSARDLGLKKWISFYCQKVRILARWKRFFTWTILCYCRLLSSCRASERMPSELLSFLFYSLWSQSSSSFPFLGSGNNLLMFFLGCQLARRTGKDLFFWSRLWKAYGVDVVRFSIKVPPFLDKNKGLLDNSLSTSLALYLLFYLGVIGQQLIGQPGVVLEGDDVCGIIKGVLWQSTEVKWILRMVSSLTTW